MSTLYITVAIVTFVLTTVGILYSICKDYGKVTLSDLGLTLTITATLSYFWLPVLCGLITLAIFALVYYIDAKYFGLFEKLSKWMDKSIFTCKLK